MSSSAVHRHRQALLTRIGLLAVVLILGGAVLTAEKAAPAAGTLHTLHAHRVVRIATVLRNGSAGRSILLGGHATLSIARPRLHWLHRLVDFGAARLRHLLAGLDENERVTMTGPVQHFSSTTVDGMSGVAQRGAGPPVASLKHTHTSSYGDLSIVSDVHLQEDTSGKPVSAKEPSVARAGDTIMVTGNWFAARSFDRGASWESLDPYSIFGNDFCCDQVMIYSPAVDRFFWLLQFSRSGGEGDDRLKLAVSSPADAFSRPCTYTFDATDFGAPSSTDVDYNDLATTDQHLYITTNLYPAGDAPSQGAVLRLPLQQLARCASVDEEYFVDQDAFHIRPAQNTGSTMYLATNDVRHEQSFSFGRNLRLYSWGDGSDTYQTDDVSVTPFNFETENYGSNDGHCNSADGVVTNWCQRTFGELTGATQAGDRLLLAAQVAPQGVKRPHPFVRIFTINLPSLRYGNSFDIYDTDYAVQYGSLAANARGDIGGVFAWGGGSGSDHNYPSMGIFTLSADGQHDSVLYLTPGEGNACKYKDGLVRWGDYLTIRPVFPDRMLFEAAGFDMENGDCGSGGQGTERIVEFGRTQDAGGS